MRLSRYFLPILRETPKEAEIVSHRLMLRAGMIRQEAAGIYAFLPLGLRVLRKVCRIVREEQDRAGAVEMLMPTLQPAELWRESGRYDDYGKEMLRIQDRHERDMLYGPTNEEMITEVFRAYVRSYKDLPLNLYHLQWKFRDELRPRFGLMRGREFLMKDAYSFDIDFAGARHAYNKMFAAYLRTFARLGLKSIPMVAESGPIGGNLSHEFIILASTGESEVYCHRDYLDFPVPPENVNFGNVEELQKIFDQWTSLYAATSEKHDAAAFAKLPADKRDLLRRLHDPNEILIGKKILIVDDNIRNIFAMTSLLERYKINVISAETGKAGIEALEKARDIDLVLMDIMLPEMDGYDTMRAIRQRYNFSELPIVALTAKAMKGDREKCIDAGASDYIAKPVETEELLSLLRNWLVR